MEAELRQLPKGLHAPLPDSCVIGRSPDADIQVFSSRVSREHAMIRKQTSGYFLYDLDSANGTEVNERSVTQPLQLNHGDVITIADMTFRFQVPGISQGNPAEPTPTSAPATVVGVRKVPMIVLVADIVNFSGLSERLSETEIAAVLKSWYEVCRSVMEEHSAQIDKFMGDGMFGYWQGTSPAQRGQAVQAARKLALGLTHLPPEQQPLPAEAGLELRCGVGLHIGETAFGAVARGTRTALGDVVNMTFRIEALTRELGESILVSEPFLQGWDAGRIGFESVGQQPIKGYTQEMELHAWRG